MPNDADTRRWNLLHSKAQQVRSVRAVELLRSIGVEPILIKGEAASQFYPDDKIRMSTDIDLAVADADFEKSNILCRSPAAAGIAIDLHRELRHLDTVAWNDLFENSRLMDIEEGNIRVLRSEDHLRVLCVHWLIDGGVDKERLWDIYYAVQNRPADFDWNRFLRVVSERRLRWLVCTLGLAKKYLDLDLDDTPIKDEAGKLPSWLTTAVETAWKVDRPQPLEASLADSATFFGQVRTRFNPNPIHATVEMEGSFDARTRLFYKIGNFAMRLLPSYRRVTATLKAR